MEESSLENSDTQAHQNPIGNGDPDPNPVNPVKLSRQQQLEEKRRALREEKLRKQREMEALLAEEEALLKAAEDELDNDTQTDVQHQPQDSEELHEKMDETAAAIDDSFSGGELIEFNQSEEYETRSELGSQEDLHSGPDPTEHEQMVTIDSEQVPDDHQESAAADDLMEGTAAGRDSYAEVGESHEPPIEAGLAGLEEEEEEEFEDVMDGEEEVQSESVEEKPKKAISPVTWDVDVHANEDNISIDSPLHSNAGSDTEENGEKKATAEKKQTPRKESASTDKSEKSSSAPIKNVDKTNIEEAEALRPRIHKYLYREAKYFMVKSSNHENIRLAKAKGVWSTPPQNEIRFNKAIDENTTVILVFSVKESGAFQGFARINGPSQKDGPKINWVLPPGISARALSGVFRLDWISRTDLAFPKTMHLRNPWNLNKPVKIARDGQEIEPYVGEQLCKLFTLDGSSDYERVISRVKRKRESLQARGITNKSTTRTPSSSYSREGSDSRGRGRGGGGYRGGLRSASSYTRGPPAQYHSRGHTSHHNPAPPPLMGYNAVPTNSMYQGRNSYDYSRSSGVTSGHRTNHTTSHNSYTSSSSSQYASGYSADMFVKSSYEEYLESMKRAGNYLHDVPSATGSSQYSYQSSRAGPPPPPIPSYTSSTSSSRDRDRDRARTNPDRYERDVEDFLRRTSGSSSSSRSYSSRTESSSHSRSSDRYRGDYRSSDGSRSDNRSDHRRDRERSRSRDRSYRDSRR